jgi:uncharacterized protein (TIGR04255 family)
LQKRVCQPPQECFIIHGSEEYQISEQLASVKTPMTFPDSPRVVYSTNPLEEVICQLKFPPILKIDSEPPAAFQDEIRSAYPLFQDIPGTLMDVPAEIIKMLPAMLPGFTGAGARSYSFESQDKDWKVALNREFVALSTTSYSRWEDFRSRLETVLNALDKHYRPSFFVRVGLRYRDVIRPSSLGIREVKWTELLQPWVLGELSQQSIAPQIRQTVRDVLISLEDNIGEVRLKHGLVNPPAGNESIYSIDCDFFKEGTTREANVIELLNIFNREAGRLFRWCITDTLRAKLGPQPVAAAR